MKMNKIDGSKISPTAIIACVSAMHNTCKPKTSKHKEDFIQNEQPDNFIEVFGSFEDAALAEEMEEMEEIERVKEIGDMKEIDNSDSFIHPTKTEKTNYIDCSKKSPNSLLASIYAKKPKASHHALNKIIKDEEKQDIECEDKFTNKTKEEGSNNCENTTQSLKDNDPNEPVSPYLQVVLLSEDEDGESDIKHSSIKDEDESNDNSANENEPKIIEIPPDVLTSFLNILNTNIGISLGSLIKITKASETEDDNYEDKSSCEDKGTEECYSEDYEDKGAEECYSEDYEDKGAEECYSEDYEDKGAEECYSEDYEDKGTEECYSEEYEDKGTEECYSEEYEDKSTEEYYSEEYEDKITQEYYYEDSEDKNTDECYYECYESENTDEYCDYYEFNLTNEFCCELYEDNNANDYSYEYQ